MNKKVRSLGLKNTQFKNCTGLDQDGHYSTAYDMTMIARELVVNHPKILEFSSIYEDYLRENTKNKFWLVNTNKVVYKFYYNGNCFITNKRIYHGNNDDVVDIKL